MNYHGHFHLIHFNIADHYYLLMLTIFMCKMYLSFSINVYVIFVPKHMYQLHKFHIWVVFLDSFYACFVFGFICNSFVFGFICNSFVINLCELLWSFSSDSSQYCCS